MGNMSYCRFENTVSDLRDCKEVLDNGELTGLDEYEGMLSLSEFNSALDLIEMCIEIADNFGGEDFDRQALIQEFKEKQEENK